MRDAYNEIAKLPPFSSVLIACRSEALQADLLERLDSNQINIIGPAEAAGTALALAALSPVDLAFIEPQLAGARNGHELADSLAKRWGVRTVLVESEGA